MATGDVVLTSDTVIEVATSVGGSYSQVSDLNTYTVNSDRQIRSFPVFMGATHTVPDPRTLRITLNGYLSVGDTGQDTLRDSERNNDIVYLKILPDGTNGTIFPVRTGTRELSGDAEGGLHRVSFECSMDGDPTEVGSGGGWLES